MSSRSWIPVDGKMAKRPSEGMSEYIDSEVFRKRAKVQRVVEILLDQLRDTELYPPHMYNVAGTCIRI